MASVQKGRVAKIIATFAVVAGHLAASSPSNTLVAGCFAHALIAIDHGVRVLIHFTEALDYFVAAFVCHALIGLFCVIYAGTELRH